MAADDVIFYGYLYQERKCFGVDYNDLITFIDLMKGLIMEIPYSVRKEKINEGYFHTVFHVISSVIGLDPLSEIETANGRLDMSFETPEIFYILEFKYNSKNEDESNKALKQIKK